MLNIQNCHSYYGDSHILHGVSLEVEKGSILAVLGRNGVGKTTLLRSIMGLTSRQTGAVTLGNVELSALPPHRRARAGLGYVPQGREIFPGFTVEENILTGCYGRTDRRPVIPDYVWTLFPMLRDHLGREGANLSGGQQQQLAIARALVADPKVLLLDEPTEGIQPNIVHQIQEGIRKMNRDLGLTVVLVEQNIEFARTAATKFIIMEKGAVAAQGRAQALSDDLVHKYMTV